MKSLIFWAKLVTFAAALALIYIIASVGFWALALWTWLTTRKPTPPAPAFDPEGGSPELPALTAEPPQAYPAEPARQKELREAYNLRHARPSWYPASVREFAEAKQGGRHG